MAPSRPHTDSLLIKHKVDAMQVPASSWRRPMNKLLPIMAAGALGLVASACTVSSTNGSGDGPAGDTAAVAKAISFPPPIHKPAPPLPPPIFHFPASCISSTQMPASLTVTSQPSSVVNGQPFSMTFSVTDADDCLITDNIQVQAWMAAPNEALIGEGGAQLANGFPVATVNNGSVTFNGLGISMVTPGPVTVQFYTMPSDATNWASATTSVTVNVTQVPGAIPWPTASTEGLCCVWPYGGDSVLYFTGTFLQVYGVYTPNVTSNFVQMASCIGVPGDGVIYYPDCGVTVSGYDPYTVSFNTTGHTLCGNSSNVTSDPANPCFWLGLASNSCRLSN
jgi:hypothetical protein